SYFVLTSIADKDGGIRALLPLFGIANQLLATMALAVGTVMIIRMGKAKWAWMTTIPLLWLAAVTLSAGWIKINDPSPKVGFLARAAELKVQIDVATTALAAPAPTPTATPMAAAPAKPTQEQIDKLAHLRFNQYLNCTLCAVFMSVIVAMLFLCAWEAWMLLSGRKPLSNTETSPVASDGIVSGGAA
ncbi:MAG TPA: carbon starvation CstA 5TM domain-containing protein, partial [Planctomycetota bacterium]|nr:carbon starvation CstA 5TM domain-containing protein [Planctomycetota bacterium]